MTTKTIAYVLHHRGFTRAAALILLCAGPGLTGTLAAAPSTVWVDDDYTVTGSNDGHTWAIDAFATLQDGVNGVADGGTVNIAPGTYKGATCSKSVKFKSTGSGVIIQGASPAWTQNSGIVEFNGQTFTLATDDPTILLNGGTLTMLNCTIDESTGYEQVAIKVTGGTLALTSGNTININGAGSFIRNEGTNAIAATGNAWKLDGTAVTSNFTIEDKIFHALDAGGGGLVTWSANNVYVTTSSGAIQRAIAAAGAGFTVNIGPGTFIETSQLQISKNLTFIGSGSASTTVTPSADTAASGDARGWWLVNSGVTLNLSQMTLDGSGYKVWQGIRHLGVGTIDHVKFTQIQYEPSGASYAGTAVAAFGGVGAVDISNCAFDGIGRVGVLYYGAGTTGTYSGNTYTGKGAGNWLDYAVEVGAGAVAIITNSTITNCTGVASSDGSTSAGILVTTYYDSGTKAKIVDNTVTGNASGIAVGYDSSDTSAVLVQGNDLTGNANAGIAVTGGTVDAGQVGGSDVTGLGISAGGNDFTGYGPDNAAPWAVENSGTGTVLAFANGYGNFANVKDVILDGADTTTNSIVGYSQSGAAYATPPGPVTVECAGQVPAGATTLASFLAQGGVLSATVATNVGFSDSALSPGPTEGTITRTYTITDLGGQTATCSQIITVDDVTPPTITCPTNVTVNADAGSCSASGVSLGTPVTGDNCGVATVVNNAPASFPVGTTSVTWTVTDVNGLSASCTQAVTVIDNQPPTAACKDITITLDASGNASITAAQVDNGSADNCGIASTTVSPGTFTFCDRPSKLVTLTVTDVNSNVSTCTATVTLADPPAPAIVYVDNNYPEGCQNVDWPYTGAGDKFIGFNAFTTIQAAIDAVAPGGTVNVTAGTYVENVAVTKPVTLLGPNAGKSATDPTRAPEAIVRSAIDDPDGIVPIISVETNDIRIDGFTIDGHTPGLGGDTTVGEVVVNGGVGIQNGEYWTSAEDLPDVTRLTVENNRFMNHTYQGIFIWNDYGVNYSGNYFRNNSFDNMWEGMQFYSLHAVIVSNTCLNVRRGFSLHQVNTAPDAGFTPVIAFNTVTVAGNTNVYTDGGTFATGIWINGRQGEAPALVVVSNVVNSPNPMADGKIFTGFRLWNTSGDRELILRDNVVNGNDAGQIGVNAWLHTGTRPPVITGGSIQGVVQDAVQVNTYDSDPAWGGYHDVSLTLSNASITLPAGAVGVHIIANAGDPTKHAHVTVTGTTVITGGATGILLEGDNATVDFIAASPAASLGGMDNYLVLASNGSTAANENVDATTVLFDGKLGSEMTLPELYAVENKIQHRLDNAALGLVRVNAANVYVTTGSGSIQRGIDAALAGDTVNVAAGAYDEALNIENRTNITILGAGRDVVTLKPSTTIDWGLGYGSARQTAMRIVGSENVTVGGITLDCDLINGDNRYGFLYWNSTGGLFEGNRFLNMTRTNGSYYDMIGYLRGAGGSCDSRYTVTVRSNEFIDTGRLGLVTHDYLHSVIEGNLFQKTTDAFGYAMEIGSTSTAEIRNNLIHGFDFPAPSDGSASGGIYVENAFTTGLPGCTKNIVIEDNEIYGCQEGLIVGNEFFGYAGPIGIVATIQRNNIHDNTDIGILLADADNSQGSSVTAQIANNDIHSNGAYGIYAYTGSDGATNGGGTLNIAVTNCSITGHATSAFVLDEWPSISTYSVSLTGNDLSENGAGVNNLVTSAAVSAEYNWWGSATGPTNALNPGGTGVAATGNVDFSPWLGLGTDTSADIGFQPDVASVYYAAHHLAFAIQPGNAAINTPLAPQPTVQVIDENGGIAVQFSGSVGIAIANNPSGATLSGTATAPVVSGVAAFSGLSLNKAGTGYTLAASTASPVLGATSAPFDISNAVPVITSLSPSWAVVGGTGFTLTVNGSGFADNSVVRWNGANRTTTNVSATQLTIPVTAGDIAGSGTASVTVFNPAPGGGESAPATFEIKPVPSVVWVDDDYTSGGGNDGHLWAYDAFTTIQAGVSHVATSGTVHVAAGTYDEAVPLNKTVSLIGPQAGVAGYDASRPAAAGEAIITGLSSSGGVQVQADNVVVDGFIIEQVDSGSYQVGVWMSAAYSGAHIDHNIIRENTMGIYLAGNGTNATAIRRNLFLANNHPGPASGDAVYSDVKVSNVLFADNQLVSNKAAMVLVAGVYGSFGPVSGLTVSNNVLDGAGTGGGFGISGQANSWFGGPDTDLIFANNTISNLGAGRGGVLLVGVDKAVVSGNQISGAGNGLDIQYANTGIAVSNNVITGNRRGMFVGGWAFRDQITAIDNAIFGNFTNNVENATNDDVSFWTIPVNASGNWWGDSSVAGVQSTLSGVVDFTPWLDVGTDTQAGVTGFQGDFSLLHIAAAGPQSGEIGRVQEGVNMIADGALTGGDRIVEVKAGAYVEDLVISNAVKLLGPNAGVAGCATRGAEAILYPATQDLDFGRVIDVAVDSVTIDGLEINGDNPDLSGGRVIGTADVDTSTGIQNGQFIDPDLVVGEFPIQHLTIQNNVFTNFTWDGAYVGEEYGTTNGWIVVRSNRFQNLSEGAQFYAVHADFSDNCASDALRLVGMHQVSGACDPTFTPRIANNSIIVSSDQTVWEARGPGYELPGRDTGLWVNGRHGSAPPLVVSDNTITAPNALPDGATFWGMIGWQVTGDRQLSFVTNTVNGNGFVSAGFVGWGLQGSVPVTLTGGALNGIKDVGVRAVNRHDYWGDASTAITVAGVPITLETGGVGVEAYDDPAAAAGFTSAVTVEGNTSISGGTAGVVTTGADASATVINNAASITGNGVGIDVNGGKALVENNTLTNNSIAAIRVQNGGTLDAGDCTGSSVTGLGTGSGLNGSSAGGNDLSGYLTGGAKAIINESGTALAYNNNFGAAPGQDILAALTGAVAYSQSGGVLVNSPLPPITVQCVGEIPTAATNFAGFIALGGVASCNAATVSSSDSPLTPGPYEGTVTRTYTLTDACGQTATAVQAISVNDTNPPAITAPANLIVSADPGQCYATAVNLGTPIATDNCGVAAVTNDAPAQFPVGTNVVTWFVTDLSGLTATGVQTVIVRDLELPVVNCPASIVTNNEPGQCGATVSFTPSATDNCGVASLVATPASGSFFAVGTHTVTVVATDIHGNTNACTFTVTVGDHEPPSANCPANIVQAVDAGKDFATVTFTLPANTDNCGVASAVAVPASGSAFAVGTNSVTVVVTDIHGNTNTCSFTVAVVALPSITTQPLSRTNYAGTTATFTVTANSPAPLTYLWKKDGAPLTDTGNIFGATTAMLTITNVSDADEADYTVEVSNLAGTVTSDAATLTVFNPPIIVVQPLDRTNNAATTAAFTVVLATNSTPPFGYQWFKNGTNALVDGGNVSGATTETLTLTNVLAADEGEYSVSISNEVAVVTSSNAVLTVIDPYIASHPAPVTAPLGSPVTFSVTAVGTEPLAYQWQWEGIDLPGETASTLSIDGIVDTDAGEYTVVVQNSVGLTISQPALLSITHPPVITLQPISQVANEGDTVIFEVSANGTIPFSYQWKKNGFDLTGENGRQLVLTGVTTASEGSYEVVVSNADGVTNSAAATLTVIVPPVITTQPLGRTNNAGSTAAFTVTLTGSPAIYSWYFNGTNLLSDGGRISGATSNVLTLTNVLGADAGVYSFVASNRAGIAISSNALLVVNDPIITAQPTNLTVNLGDPAGFTVTAYGTTPAYQWRKGGIPIDGATSPTLSISSATADDAGQYDVVVSNQYAIVVSDTVTLAVTIPPTITGDPVSLVRNAGQTAVFTVTVSGTAPFRYQWKKGGLDIDGATNDTLTLTNVSQADAAAYTVLVSNPAGDDLSGPATLTVIDPPVITADPLSRTNAATTTAWFSVTVAGTAPSYQWFKNGTNALVDDGFVSGANSNVLTLVNVLGINRGEYSVVVSNAAGVMTSSAATLTVIDPAIFAQPIGQTNVIGSTVTFSVTAVGTTPLTYQWYQDGTALFGKTASTLVLTNISSSDAGAYTVVITNSAGSMTSAPALLVTFPPLITSQPANVTVNQGQPASFSVSATGQTPFSYQWQKDSGAGWTNVPNATNRIFTISSAQGADAGSYRVIVTNPTGSETSQSATLTVIMPPSITTQPSSQTNVIGASVTFNVSVAGTTPFHYQWRKGAADILNQTNAELVLASITAADAATYSVVVTNAAGLTTSLGAVLTVVDQARLTIDSYAAGNATLSLTASAGHRYAIQATTDFANWQNLHTNAAPYTFIDTNAGSFTYRFYRGVFVP